MNSLSGTDRAQTAVLGNLLLVAIAIVLGSIIVVVALGILENPAAPPYAAVEVENGERVLLMQEQNLEEVLIQDEAGNIHGRMGSVGDTVSLAEVDPRLEYSIIAVGAEQSSKIRTLTASELIGDISEPSSSPASVTASDIEGDGSESNPFIIRTDSELQAVGNETANLSPKDSYRLGNNIDASKTDEWNGGDGFDPIQDFEGAFDGDGHRILGLTIARESEDNVGLFANVKKSGEIKSFSVEDFAISGANAVGGVVGENQGTIMEVSGGYQVSDVYDDAVVGNQNVGGLVGENINGGQIIDSSVRGKITGDSSEIAGLVGFNDGTVENSVSTATVTIEELGNRHVAGLVGTNEGTISDSYATGDVTVNDAQDDFPRVGGLVGENFGTIERSHATGDVTGVEGASSSNHNYGGLVGIHWVGTIEESFATGDVETDGRAGSLVGRVSQLQASGTATISNSYATGSVTSREDTAGGIVGSLHNGYELEIDNSFATGQISGRDTGGLVGEIGSGGDVDLEDSYWDNKTTGQSAAVGDGSADTTTNVEGLTTSQMAGNDADKNMELDFKEIWRTVSGSYPKFQWES